MNIQSPSPPSSPSPSMEIDDQLSLSQDPAPQAPTPTLTPIFDDFFIGIDTANQELLETVTVFIDALIEEAVQKLSQSQSQEPPAPVNVKKAESDKCLILLARARDRANSRAAEAEIALACAPELECDPQPHSQPQPVTVSPVVSRLIDPAPKPSYGYGKYEPSPSPTSSPPDEGYHPDYEYDYDHADSCKCGRHLPWSPLMGLFDKIKRGSLKKKNGVNIASVASGLPAPAKAKMTPAEIVGESDPTRTPKRYGYEFDADGNSSSGADAADEEEEAPYVRIVVDNNGPGPRPRASSLKGPTLGAGIDLGALARLGVHGGAGTGRRVSFSEAVLVQGLDDNSTRFVATLAPTDDTPTPPPSPFTLPLWEKGQNDVYRPPRGHPTSPTDADEAEAETVITSGRGEVRFKAPVEFIENDSLRSSQCSSQSAQSQSQLQWDEVEEEAEGQLKQPTLEPTTKPGDMTRL